MSLSSWRFPIYVIISHTRIFYFVSILFLSINCFFVLMSRQCLFWLPLGAYFVWSLNYFITFSLYLLFHLLNYHLFMARLCAYRGPSADDLDLAINFAIMCCYGCGILRLTGSTVAVQNCIQIFLWHPKFILTMSYCFLVVLSSPFIYYCGFWFIFIFNFFGVLLFFLVLDIFPSFLIGLIQYWFS